MNIRKCVEIQLWNAERKREKTQTAAQAFCLVCNKGVTPPHSCPGGKSLQKRPVV